MVGGNGLDVLYLVGPGSKWEDNELRYSLRSVEQHLPHRRVVLAGHHPPWLTGLHHVVAGDRYGMPVQNTLHKLLAACNSGVLAERFVMMNDDFLLLRDLDPDAKAGIAGTMQQRITEGPRGADPHYDVLLDGMHRLRMRGIPEPLNYEVHEPLVMERAKVLAMAEAWGGSGKLYPWRSVYGNMHGVPAEYRPDVKQRRVFHMPAHGQRVLSVCDAIAEDDSFRQWCSMRWMAPSRYERAPDL